MTYTAKTFLSGLVSASVSTFVYGYKTVVNSFKYTNKITRDTLILSLYNNYVDNTTKNNTSVDDYIILQLKKLGYYSLNLNAETNDYIIDELFHNVHDYEYKNITELVENIKDSDGFQTFLTNFYKKTNRCTELLKNTYSNDIKDFLNCLTIDEVLILHEV
jgi:hypothetical protein